MRDSEKLDAVKNAVKTSIKALNEISNIDYYFGKMKEYETALFERFAPFKVGDRVVLIKTPIINEKEASGWLGFKHFLVEGIVGVVRETGYSNNKFNASVLFEGQNYLEVKSDGSKISGPTSGNTFCFDETYLQKLEPCKHKVVVCRECGERM